LDSVGQPLQFVLAPSFIFPNPQPVLFRLFLLALADSNQPSLTPCSEIQMYNFILIAISFMIPLSACRSISKVEAKVKILDGTPAALGEFDAVVALTVRTSPSRPPVIDCTGILVHPKLVITAAHCLESYGDIFSTMEEFVISVGVYQGLGSIGGQVTPQWRTTSASYLPEYSDYRLGWADIAYVVLEKPLEGITPIPVITNKQILKDVMKIGYPAILVGYGFQDDNGHGGRFGVKMTRSTTISKIRNRALEVGMNQQVIGKGDSGGPLLVRDTHGQLGLLGVLSHSIQDIEGDSGTTYALIPPAIKWIAEHSGIKPETR
jgi:V8-like Glu-specific endopeptidase